MAYPVVDAGREKMNARLTPPGQEEYATSGPVEAVVRAFTRSVAQGEAVWTQRRPAEYQWSDQWNQWLRQWYASSMSAQAMRPGRRFTGGTQAPQSREGRAALCAEDTEVLPRDIACKP